MVDVDIATARRHAKLWKARVAQTGLVHRVREYANRRRETSPFFTLYPARFNPRDVEQRILISRPQRFIYFRIPKAANTTVVASLMASQGIDTSDPIAVERYKRGPVKASLLAREEVETMVADFFKFTIVRNPYTRILSAYLDRVVRNKAESLVVRNTLGIPSPDPVSFVQFLDFLEFRGGLQADPHWARQTDLLGLPPRMLDRVGRFERLQDDLPDIMGTVFGTDAQTTTVSPHATRANELAKVQSAETLARVYRLYEPDFDAFGYPRAI